MASKSINKPTVNATNSSASGKKIIKPVASSEPVVDNSVLEENQVLKKQLEQMQAQMTLMMKQMASQSDFNSTQTSKERNIPFINLVPGTFVLKGSQVWDLKGQFAQRSFREREARIIATNMPNAIRKGYIYIADAQFVEENDLEEIYQYLLNDTQLKTLLDNKAEYVVELYKNASPSQQNIIIDMIADKKTRGEEVDGNVLIQLTKLSGKDLVNMGDEEGE